MSKVKPEGKAKHWKAIGLVVYSSISIINTEPLGLLIDVSGKGPESVKYNISY